MPETRLLLDGRRLFVDVKILRPDPATDLTSLTAKALVDTGATVSGIGPRLIRELDLRSYGKKRLKSATDERFVDYYFFRLGLQPTDSAARGLPFIFDGLDGFSWGRDADFEVVLGMDVICRCDLFAPPQWRGQTDLRLTKPPAPGERKFTGGSSWAQ